MENSFEQEALFLLVKALIVQFFTKKNTVKIWHAIYTNVGLDYKNILVKGFEKN